MKGKSIIVACIFAIGANAVNAGFVSNTAHSRGNCLDINESITWNWSEYHWWSVRSIHFRQHGNGTSHHKTMPMAYTWRAAALCTAENAGVMRNNWWVQGYHYYMNYNGQSVFDVYTHSDNCSGYDGWWDRPKAKGE